MDASNYFSGAVESSSSSANDLNGSKPRHHMRPLGPLRRTDHYVALLSAYVADAASLRSPPATSVERSSAASPSSPEDDSSPVPEDLTYDGSYLLRFLGIESLPDSSSEGQVTYKAETKQKPTSHHKDSHGHQEHFVSEDGSEIHNVNVQLQDDSFKNPDDSSNQGEVAPIHHNSWSTEDWNIITGFNDKYMQMPPEDTFAVGPRLPPPPFYSVADQYLLPISLGIQSPPSSSERQVADNAEANIGTSANQKPMSHKDSDGHGEQLVADDQDTQESGVESGSEIPNVNVQLQDDSFKNFDDSSNQGEVAPIHHNSWSTEDWNIIKRFDDKYMQMPPEDTFAVGPRLLPPPFYFDADQYLLPISLGIQSPPSSSERQVADNAETNIGTSANQKPMSHKDSGGHGEQLVADDQDTQESRVESGSEINKVNVQLQNDSFKNPNNDSSNHQSEVALAPIHCNSWSAEDWNIHTIFNNKYMDMPPQAAFAAGPRLLPPPPFYSDDADQYLLPSSLSPTYGGSDDLKRRPGDWDRWIFKIWKKLITCEEALCFSYCFYVIYCLWVFCT